MSRGQEEALEQQKAESIKHDVLFFLSIANLIDVTTLELF